MLNEITRNQGHPEHGDGISQDQQAVGSAPFRTDKPISEQQEHGWKDEALSRAQQDSNHTQQPKAVKHTKKGSTCTPYDEQNSNETPDTNALHQNSRRELEEKVAKKEKAAE
jgi:hypothetical protein